MIGTLGMAVTEIGVNAAKNHLVPKFAAHLENKTNSFVEADKKISSAVHLPKEIGSDGGKQGVWKGQVGNGKWIPTPERIPKQPDGNSDSFGKILGRYNVDGIMFKNGEPNFKPFSEATVKINNFDERRKNFAQADMILAKQKGWKPREVKDFREKNKLTWHENNDCKTLDLVDRRVHANIPHSGGFSKYKSNFK